MKKGSPPQSTPSSKAHKGSPDENLSDVPQTESGARPNAQPSPATCGEDESTDWDAVRRAYEAKDETVRAIAHRFGITTRIVQHWARKEGWTPRRPPRRKPNAQTLPELGGDATTRERRTMLAARLFHVLEERIMAAEEEAMVHDATHSERDAKAVTAMARALDVLGDMLEALPATGGSSTRDPSTHDLSKHEEIDIDAFRERLTQRLAGLCKGEDGG